MRKRLNQDRQIKLEPNRMEYAISNISRLGFSIYGKTERSFQFNYKGATITFFPYTGWATGKTIQDGRGIHNLIKQISINDPM